MPDPFAHARLTGKAAIVTGAAQGIGEAVARLFAARGISGLMLVDRNAEKGEAVAASLREAGVDARFLAAELSDIAAVEAVAPTADAAFHRIDILVNAAGMTDRGTVWETTPALWDLMFAINVRAPMFLMQGAIRVMKREAIAGAIVNIVSVNAHGGTSFLTPYSASKGALATLTKNAAHSLAWDHIRVNGLNVGWADTPGEHATLKRFHNAADDWLAGAEKSQPFGRLLKPDEIARAVAWLATDESGIMTGSVIDYGQTVVGPNERIGPTTPKG